MLLAFWSPKNASNDAAGDRTTPGTLRENLLNFHGATVSSKISSSLRTFRYLPGQSNPGRPRIMYHLRMTPNEGRVGTFIEDANAPLRSAAAPDAPHHRYTVTEWDESLDQLMKSKLLNPAGAQVNAPGWSARPTMISLDGYCYTLRGFTIRAAPVLQRRDSAGNVPLGILFEIEFRPLPAMPANSPMLLEVLQTILGPCPEKELKVWEETPTLFEDLGLAKPTEGWNAAHKIAAYVTFFRKLEIL